MLKGLRNILSPCPQTDLWVLSTACWSCPPPSCVSGSCTSSYSSSAGPHIPSPRGSAVGSQTPVAGKHKHTEGVMLQNNRIGTKKGGNVKCGCLYARHMTRPSELTPPLPPIHSCLFFRVYSFSLWCLLQSQRPAENNGAQIDSLELPRGSAKNEIRISSPPELQSDYKYLRNPLFLAHILHLLSSLN